MPTPEIEETPERRSATDRRDTSSHVAGFRNLFLVGGAILVVILHLLLDPEAGIVTKLPFGASTLVLISTLLKSIWFIGLLHASRRALFPSIDLSIMLRRAEASPEGAGNATIGMGLFTIAAAICIAAAVLSN